MKIKTKLTLGVGLLLILIILLSIVGARYMNALKSDTENILVANYNTLEYSRNMLLSLEDHSKDALMKFETNLQSQEKNITEIGEKDATAEVRNSFEIYKLNKSDSLVSGEIRKGIFKLMDLNMQAIQRKSEVAKATADDAVFWIAITGTMCFLIAFILLVNLPSNIANPIKELTESIKQIAAKKYSQRVHFESHSEFGQLAESFNTMAKKLEEYNSSNLAKLMMEKTRIETLINNMHDPVIGLDENLKVIFANEEAQKIIGIELTDIIGHYAQELAVKNDLLRTLIQDLVNKEPENISKAKPIKIYADKKEGYFEKETLHISITPTGEQAKQLIGHVIILRNVTEYKELDLAKTNFIATVSHEFKTPISSIKMSLQLLGNEQIGKLNEEQRNLLDSISDDTTRLLKITSELLNITQVESGNIQLAIVPSDPKEILHYAISATQTQADQKQIKFEVDCPEHISQIQADNEKTAWVLTNLISNAIRYSYDNSTVYLTIKEQNNKVHISVRDTGQGIAPQYKSKVFDRYFRVPGTKKEGTGLGLAISKEFIEAQNGQIKVDSEFGAGSTFTVTLNTLT
ncbi:HAMP domain-containing sensor histidine kinase [Aurantibacillus circumpalustris]|uniref:HAMP domain-containing sensor histidine kinase n=1 Tax=Aurantibacillus circumpalustris TaxID=3036359 RepID=UPI00295BE02D|nr:ATP-binding protein [Aurantibacillus circumpalustris]